MKKQFLAIITLHEEDMLAQIVKEKGEEFDKDDVKLHIQDECNWVNESGFSISVLREIGEGETFK
jgi:hypothetical protein